MASLYLNQKFNSFDEFEAARSKYQDTTFVRWVTGNSATVRKANADIVAKGGSNLFKADLKYRYLKYTCKFGGQERTGTGKGVRPMQETHKIGCEAKLELSATRTHLVVDVLNEQHNHELSEAIYQSLPENRNLSDQAAEKVKLLFDGGVSPAVARSVLRGLTGNVTARDLSNYRAKWKKEANNGMSEKERLVDTLENLVSNDNDASVYVANDESGDLKYLFIQTSGMKRNVQKYGKVLIMDHSHKVNRNRMPVCVLMVMDGDGNGRSAGYAFVANEQIVTVADVLTSFRESISEEVACKVKTIIIDKDPSEIAAIQQVFPNAHIQLCIFHVAKLFKEKGSKESAEVKEILEKLKYVQSEEAYDALCKELKEKASKTFSTYFEDSWQNCPQAWSYKDKKNSVNFGNTTTNRVENHNSKIKMILNANSTLADAVEGLLNVFLNKEEDVLHRETVASMKRAYKTTALNDPTVNAILNDLRKLAANILIYELENIPDEEEIVEFEGSSDNCSCPHHWMYDLPCRHMFQSRRLQGEQVYRLDEIEEMWRKKKSADLEPVPPGLVQKRLLTSIAPKKPQEKFNAAQGTGKEISSLLSECGTKQFLERHSLLKSLLKMWCEGKEVVLLEKPKGADSATYTVQPCIATVVEDAEASTADEVAESTTNETDGNNSIDLDDHESDNESGNDAGNGNTNGVNGIVIITLDSDDENDIQCTQNVVLGVKVEPHDSQMDVPLNPVTESLGQNSSLDDDAEANLRELISEMDKDSPIEKITFQVEDFDGKLTEQASQQGEGLTVQAQSQFKGLPAEQASQQGEGLSVETQSQLEGHSAEQASQQGEGFNVEDQSQVENVQQNSQLHDSPKEQDLSFLFDDEEDSAMTEVVKSFEKSADCERQSNVQPIQLCFCQPRMPSVRYISGPSSSPQMVGRPYFACAVRKCTFWRLAKMTDQEKQERQRGKACRNISQALEGVNLPVVKPRGRPKGSQKTVNIKFKKNEASNSLKKPRGAQPTCFQIAKEARQTKGLIIDNSDVLKLSDDCWIVKSQRDKKIQYTVTRNSCNCPDFTKNLALCKHIYKVRSIAPEKLTVEALVENGAACCTCRKGEPQHPCEKCKKFVHALPECSTPTLAGEEGHGKPRICLACSAKPDRVNNQSINLSRKRPLQENLDLIEKAPVPPKKAVGQKPQPQTSRFGRRITKPVVFTPSKTGEQ